VNLQSRNMWLLVGALSVVLCLGCDEAPAPPAKVDTPVPGNFAFGQPDSADLSWAPAAGASSYDVYLGTDQALVGAADTVSGEYMGNQTALTYTPALGYFTTYYWRVDSVGAGGTTKGDVWRFSTAQINVTTPDLGTFWESTLGSLTLAYSDTGGSGTVTWGATGLPSGLTCSAAGVISGEVDVAEAASSPFTVHVTVTDATLTGLTNSADLQLVVKEQEYYWSRRIGGTGADAALGVCVVSGSAYVAGRYSDTVDFADDFATSADSNSSVDGWDAFVTKVASDGSYEATYVWGGTGSDSAEAVCADSSGNVYVVGAFYNTVNFAASWAGTENKDPDTAGKPSSYLLKINADGTYGWTKVFGGPQMCWPTDVCCDGSDNVFVVGMFGDTVNFAADWSGTDEKAANAGEQGGFIMKVGSDGTYGWTHAIGGLTSSAYMYGVATDVGGNVYVCGEFSGTVNFEADWSGTDPKTSGVGTGAFLTRVVADGSYSWTRVFSGNSNATAQGVAVSGSSVYLGGYFSGTVDFRQEWGEPVDEKISAGSDDAFVVKVGTDGSYGWARRIGGSGQEWVNDIAVDSTAKPIAFGTFQSPPTDFGTDFAVSEVRDAEADSSFAMRINADGTYDSTLFLIGTVSHEGVTCYAGCIDDSDGIRMVGYMGGDINFAADWSGDDTRTSAGGSDAFVTRLAH